jgi:hypothetical protein
LLKFYERNIEPLSAEMEKLAIDAIAHDMDIGELTEEESETESPKKKKKKYFTDDGKPTNVMLNKHEHEVQVMCERAMGNRCKRLNLTDLLFTLTNSQSLPNLILGPKLLEKNNIGLRK